MDEPGFLRDVLVLLLAPVIVVPIFRRLRSSPILGYLAAGVLVGPYALGLVTESTTTHALAELGVAFLLFAIGLELSLDRLKVMRRLAFGLGTLQVVATGAAIALTAWLMGFGPGAAIIIGGGLALSSTAFVLRLLVERGEQVARFGRATFAILLLQDLAVLPMLVLVSVLRPGQGAILATLGLSLLKAALALAVIILVGRLVLRPAFRMVVATRSPELFVSATLLIVLGTGWVMTQTGLSMALGAFLAGVLLSETEYRHQVEADIRPFRGLLLGLFFLTVGLSLNLALVMHELAEVLAIVFGLVAGKAVLVTALCLLFGLPAADALRVGLLLAPGGEFGFVLFEAAMGNQVLDHTSGETLIAAVALSMAMTPFMADAGDALVKRFRRAPAGELEALRTEAEPLSEHVVVGGFGRVGQTVGKVLTAAGIPYVALDLDSARVGHCRARKLPVFFGDVSRFDVLAAAGAGRARAAVLTIDQPQAVETAVTALGQHFPELPVFVRGRDVRQSRRLQQLGAAAVVPEAVEASLQLGSVVLLAVGASREEATRIVDRFRGEEYAALETVAPDGG